MLTWLAALLAELSVPVFLAFGVGHEILNGSAQTSFAIGNLAETQRLLAIEEEPDKDPPKGRRKTTSLPRTLPANFKTKPVASNVVYLPGKHPVISALELAGKHLSNEKLAATMGCRGGEASKRRKEVANLLHQYRQGHRIMMGLKSWQYVTA